MSEYIDNNLRQLSAEIDEAEEALQKDELDKIDIGWLESYVREIEYGISEAEDELDDFRKQIHVLKNELNK